MKHYLIAALLPAFILLACNGGQSPADTTTTKTDVSKEYSITLDLKQANRLAALPLRCMVIEYPNKTSQVLGEASDLGTPGELHPAFYGCFDWHSAVHGHWSLIKLLKTFPDLDKRDSIILKIKNNISRENIAGEITYFNRQQEYSYERMYGWTWLLKLQQEADTWDTDDGREIAAALQPLTDLLVDRYIEFLPKLQYPLRVGMHTNSAFGMSFAHDYAVHSKNDKLKTSIEVNARRLYFNDTDCPINWEPDGFDFLSPCLEELTLMQRILPEESFLKWAEKFLPQLKNKDFDMEVAKVSDRTDGHLVHLDGLNFSRAWVFYRLAHAYPDQYGHLKNLGDKHLDFSLHVITDGSYEGEHWLGSFALYALSERN